MRRTDHCAPCHFSASGILATLCNAQNYYSFLIQHKYLLGDQSNELLDTHYTTSTAAPAFYASYVCTNITKTIYCSLHLFYQVRNVIRILMQGLLKSSQVNDLNKEIQTCPGTLLIWQTCAVIYSHQIKPKIYFAGNLFKSLVFL